MIAKELQLVLGSASPRRKQLLEAMKLEFTVRAADLDEILPPGIALAQAAEYLAVLKSEHIHRSEHELLITADSIVMKGGHLLGKPGSKEEAQSHLKIISDAWHTVYTGVCLRQGDRIERFTDQTEVKIGKISDLEIDCYIESGQAYDKAGAYGIQDWIGWVKVESIKGSYANVMGLPTHRVYEALKNWS